MQSHDRAWGQTGNGQQLKQAGGQVAALGLQCRIAAVAIELLNATCDGLANTRNGRQRAFLDYVLQRFDKVAQVFGSAQIGLGPIEIADLEGGPLADFPEEIGNPVGSFSGHSLSLRGRDALALSLAALDLPQPWQ